RSTRNSPLRVISSNPRYATPGDSVPGPNPTRRRRSALHTSCLDSLCFNANFALTSDSSPDCWPDHVADSAARTVGSRQLQSSTTWKLSNLGNVGLILVAPVLTFCLQIYLQACTEDRCSNLFHLIGLCFVFVRLQVVSDPRQRQSFDACGETS